MGDSVAVFFFRDSFFRSSYGLQVEEQFQMSPVNPFKDLGDCLRSVFKGQNRVSEV